MLLPPPRDNYLRWPWESTDWGDQVRCSLYNDPLEISDRGDQNQKIYVNRTWYRKIVIENVRVDVCTGKHWSHISANDHKFQFAKTMKLHSATVFLVAQGLAKPLLVRADQSHEISKNSENVLTGSYSLRAYKTTKTIMGSQEPKTMESKVLKGLCIPSKGKNLEAPDIGILGTDVFGSDVVECLGKDEACMADSSSPLGGFCASFDWSQEKARNLSSAGVIPKGRRDIGQGCFGGGSCPDGAYCYTEFGSNCYSCESVTTAFCNSIQFVRDKNSCLNTCVPNGDPVHGPGGDNLRSSWKFNNYFISWNRYNNHGSNN